MLRNAVHLEVIEEVASLSRTISWQTLPISEMRKLKQLKMVLLIIKTLNTDIGIEVAPEFQQWLELEIIFQL